jgi:hypothetical protein
MVLQYTLGAHGSLSTDHPFIDDDWPAVVVLVSLHAKAVWLGKNPVR